MMNRMDTLLPIKETASPCFLGLTLKGDGDEPTVEQLQTQLSEANEKITQLESSRGDWKKEIDPNPDSNPTLSKYKTQKDLFQAHMSLLQKMGDQANLIRPPKDAADKDGWNTLAKVLNVPEKADDYKFPEVARPKGMPADQKQEAEFRKVAHELKLAPHQVEGLYKFVAERNAQEFTRLQTEAEQKSKNVESELQTEYGAAWPEKKEMAQKLVDKFAPDPAKSPIADNFLRDPGVIRMFVKIAERFSEDGILEGDGGRGRLTPKEARAEINKIMADDKHAYHNNDAPGHKEAVDYVSSLYEMEAAGSA